MLSPTAPPSAHFLGCDLRSFKQKALLTNSLALSAKILERHTHFGAQPHSVSSLVGLLDEYHHLSAPQPRLLTAEEREFFGESLKSQLPQSNYFRHAFEISGLRAKVFDCVEELRLAGYSAMTLSSDTIENTEKVESLKEIFAQYELYLARKSIRDYPLILRSVITHLQEGTFDTLLSNFEILTPFALDLKGMETSFLEVLAEKVCIYSPASPTQSFLTDSSPASINLAAFKKSLEAHLAQMSLENPTPLLPEDQSLQVRTALTPEETFAQVFHWFHERSANIGNSALVTPNYDAYAGPLYRFSLKHGLRLNLSHGLLASEFAFFAQDLAELDSLFLELKRENHSRNFPERARGHFLKRFCEHAAFPPFRSKALAFIQNYLSAQQAFETVAVPESHCWDLLRAHLLALRIPSSALELDRQGLFFGRPQDLLGCEIDHLAIVSLQDHHYPPKIIPNPILTDEERQALNERIEQGAFVHELALSAPPELQKDLLEKISLSVRSSLLLTFESHDLSSGSRSLPSSFLNRVLAAFGLKMNADSLYEISGGLPDSFYPRLTPSRLLVDYDEHLACKNQVDSRFEKWSQLLSRRGNRERNQEDGVTLTGSRATLLQAQYSSSTLTDFFSCPYRFYLKKVVGLPEIETERRDNLQWLDQMMRGTLIHAVFEGFVKLYLKGPQSATAWLKFLREDAPECLEPLITEAAHEFTAEARGVPRVVIDGELAEIRSIAQEFLHREVESTEQSGFYPIGAEIEFKDLLYSWQPSEAAAPLSLTFKGTIDRLDTDGRGNYRVVDYKTGRNHFKDASNLFQDREGYAHFQHAVYAHWVKAQPELKANESQIVAGYYYTSDKGKWDRVEASWGNLSRQFSAAMEVFHSTLASGCFPKNEGSCRNCGYRLICGGIQGQRKAFIAPSPELERLRASLQAGSSNEDPQ